MEDRENPKRNAIQGVNQKPRTQGESWWRKKRFSIVELIAILFVLYFFLSPIFFILMVNMSAPSHEFRKLMEGDYVIENGTYVGEKVVVWSPEDIHVRLNVTSGGPVDVFIMSVSQYGIFKNSSGAMGYIYALKNVTEADFTTEVGRTCYVVVDNSDIPIIGDDATPRGDVTVHLRIDERYSYYAD